MGQDDQSLGFGCVLGLELPLLGENLLVLACLAATLELKTEKTKAHGSDINSVAFSPDGTKIVSASDDETIKVWDAGANLASNRLSLSNSDHSWLP